MIKKLVKDFLRDIVRAFVAWLNTTDNGRAFAARFEQASLESSAKASNLVTTSVYKGDEAADDYYVHKQNGKFWSIEKVKNTGQTREHL